MILLSNKYGTGTLISELNGKATINFNGKEVSLLVKFAKLTKEDGSDFEATIFEEKEIEVKKVRKTRKVIAEKFVTKADLTEYKNLIIWLLKNKTNYSGYLNLSSAMTILLKKAKNNEITYKTKRGIKGSISRATISAGLQDSENNLRNFLGLDITALTNGNSELENFQQFRLNALMN